MKRIQVMVTQRCNSHCSYCMVSRDAKDFDLENIGKFKEIVKENGIDTLLLFGGEPLLREDICESLRENFEGKIILPTNGLLLREEHTEKYDNILISSNGTPHTCELTGQPYIAKILDIKNKAKCTIGIRIIPETAKRMFLDFLYFWEAGFTRFNIMPITEMEWTEEQLEEYKLAVILINNMAGRDKVWTWRQGGICVPYERTICIDQDCNIYGCARFCSDKKDCPHLKTTAFSKCLKCELLPYCFHNCHYNHQVATGSLVYPDPTICKFARVYKEVFAE